MYLIAFVAFSLLTVCSLLYAAAFNRRLWRLQGHLTALETRLNLISSENSLRSEWINDLQLAMTKNNEHIAHLTLQSADFASFKTGILSAEIEKKQRHLREHAAQNAVKKVRKPTPTRKRKSK